MNKWLYLFAGFGVGFGIGGFLVKQKMDKDFDEVADDIYNQCYADVKKEYEEYEGDTIDECVPATPEEKAQAEYKRVVKEYKPPLREVFRSEDGEMVINEIPEIEEVSSGLTFEEENNVVKDTNEAHMITEMEFRQENLHYSKADIFWYSVDNVFTDDADQILDADDPFFEFSRETVEAALRMGREVYVRIPTLETDFELHNMKSSFQDIAYETVQERQTRIGRRRLRMED